jgi:hypothetical protein
VDIAETEERIESSSSKSRMITDQSRVKEYDLKRTEIVHAIMIENLDVEDNPST